MNNLGGVKYLFCLVVAGVGLSAHAADSHGKIQVRPLSEVQSAKDIFVGDIADPENVPEASWAVIRNMRLGDAPKAGEVRKFTDTGLSQILREQIKEHSPHGDVALVLPAVVQVKRKAFRLDRNTVEQELKKTWQSLCPKCEFEISQLNLPLTAENISWDTPWALRTRGEMPKGSFSIPLDINLGEVSKRTYWITGQVQIFKTVPLASRSYVIGDRVDPQDVTWQRKEVTFSSDNTATLQDLQSAYANRPILANQIIERGQIRRESAVKAGETVHLVTGSDGWQVTIEGVAQQTGFLGEQISVKIPRTQKLVSGLITDRGTVEVK